jgi:hypothetical protein
VPFAIEVLEQRLGKRWAAIKESRCKSQSICRMTFRRRRQGAVQRATGLVHAIAEAENEKVAITVGPLTGRMTAKQIHDAVQPSAPRSSLTSSN